MQRALVAALVLIGVFAFAFARVAKQPRIASPVPTAEQWYDVVRVVDGDTLTARIEGKDVRVRMIGVDTPESVDPRTPVQCFAEEAADETRKILSGASVRLETDPSQATWDKYGRLLAYVYAPAGTGKDGVLVNLYLIEEGFGHEYTYNAPYKFQTTFKEAQRKAREKQKGLWAPGVCI